ncbi:hypothetical protein L1887_62722 [Cichorium endivia]|nr:hypothetical protein L1887_62722 [Cichorium endivia]
MMRAQPSRVRASRQRGGPSRADRLPGPSALKSNYLNPTQIRAFFSSFLVDFPICALHSTAPILSQAFSFKHRFKHETDAFLPTASHGNLDHADLVDLGKVALGGVLLGLEHLGGRRIAHHLFGLFVELQLDVGHGGVLEELLGVAHLLFALRGFGVGGGLRFGHLVHRLLASRKVEAESSVRLVEQVVVARVLLSRGEEAVQRLLAQRLVQAELLAQTVELELDARHALFERRIAARVQARGALGVGHGDLHLGQIQSTAYSLLPRRTLRLEQRDKLVLETSRQTHSLVAKRGVELHCARTRLGKVQRVLRSGDTAASDDGQLALEPLVHRGERTQRQRLYGWAREAARFAYVLRRAQRRRTRDGRVADHQSVDTALERRIRHIVQLLLAQIRCDLDEQRHLHLFVREAQVRFDHAVARLDHLRKQILEHAAALQPSQPRRVGAAHVHDDHVGVRTQTLDALDIIVDTLLLARLVLAQVDAEHLGGAQAARQVGGIDKGRGALGMRGDELPGVGRSRVGRGDQGVLQAGDAGRVEKPSTDTVAQAAEDDVVALRVEAEAVDAGVVLGEAEVARLRVARLRLGRDATDLDEAEAEVEQAVDRLGLLVKARCEADGVGERAAKQLRLEHRIVVDHVARCESGLEHLDRELLCALRIGKRLERRDGHPAVDGRARVGIVRHAERAGGESEDEVHELLGACQGRGRRACEERACANGSGERRARERSRPCCCPRPRGRGCREQSRRWRGGTRCDRSAHRRRSGTHAT